MRIPEAFPGAAILTMAAASMLLACERDPVRVDGLDTAGRAPVAAVSPVHTAASGAFTQTAITSLDVRLAGPNSILEQRSEGSISGTLTGDYEDDLKVVIHPNGRFNAHFTITCVCTVAGRQGVLEMVADDRGELAGPDIATFAGRAVIRGGTGELAGLRGVLRIEGTIDLPTGLATYTYAGSIHFHP